MFYVYVLYSEKINKHYIGHTEDVDKRLEIHNNGKNRFTSNKGPWRLIYKEEVGTRSEAMKKEKFFKTGKGREYWKSKAEENQII